MKLKLEQRKGNNNKLYHTDWNNYFFLQRENEVLICDEDTTLRCLYCIQIGGSLSYALIYLLFGRRITIALGFYVVFFYFIPTLSFATHGKQTFEQHAVFPLKSMIQEYKTVPLWASFCHQSVEEEFSFQCQPYFHHIHWFRI